MKSIVPALTRHQWTELCEAMARSWHLASDHAADGTPFGGPLCNCEQVATRAIQLGWLTGPTWIEATVRFIKASPAVTLAGSGGAYERIEQALASSGLSDTSTVEASRKDAR